jgi:puromycin-sensitive aminopeptidase
VTSPRTTTNERPGPDELDPYRLPRHVRPRRYDIELEPDLTGATFSGRVVISADLDATTRSIVLNAAELDVQRVFVDGRPAPFSLDERTERLLIGTIDELAPGPIAIDVEFTGILNDKLRGFYRSTYRDVDGVEHVVGCTQMQATDCRRAFPCFDEPDFKAVFAVTLVVDDGLLAVSNGPEIRRTRRDDKVAVTFADTMPMSTYLVAFVVGRLEATEAVDVGGVPLRIVHVPGKGHLTDFGLDVGAASLRWFTAYYGIPYPDAKIDMIALPDFAAGAMENVGCITYRESLLLVDPSTSTQVEKELVADVVSHELAHMWFGDLVTMKWWNGIWLNEAFATFMEVAAVDAYRPDWKRWTSFSLERSVAFETDSLVSTRPVEYEVRSPADCEGMFDVLTYQKGGALLRMLEQYLGVERFRAGVRHYLAAHSYGNTETSDLWDSIEAAVSSDGGEPVRRLMDSWIWQPGYPLVSADLVTTSDGSAVRLTQQRFLFDVTAEVPHQSWLVPVHLRLGDGEELVLLDDEPIEIPLARAEDVVIVNSGGHGFYRVAYSPELLARVDRSVLARSSTVERYNLVDDAWSAVVAGRLSAVDFLDFLDSFVDERDLAVWQVVANGLRSIGRLVGDDAYVSLQRRIRELASPALAALGWEPVIDEDELIGKLRGLLVALVAVNGGDADAVERCRTLLADAQRDPSSVHPELAAAATTVVANHGDTATYDDMQQRFLTADNPQEQLRYLYALAEFDSPDLMRRTCEFAMSGDVKTQNAPFLLARCIAHRRHGRLAWDFVRRHWAVADEKFPSNTIVRMIDPVKSLNTPDAEADVRAFFAEHPVPQAAKTLEQVLERQRVNVALREREQTALEARLR